MRSSKARRFGVGVGVLVAAGALFALGRCTATPGLRPEERAGEAPTAEAQETIWTCPMHPQIRRPEAGDCPLCGMDLVRLEGDAAASTPLDQRRLSLSPAAVALAQVETALVRREAVARSVRMIGKLDFDETAMRTIAARVPGRLERLYVDYTGVPVRAGDHLVHLYSPDLLNAQEELFAARERLTTTADEVSPFLAQSNRRAYEAVREKLLLWGLTEAQVAEIEERGTPEDRMSITSPSSGVVVEKFLDEGAYVQTGTRIYRIADLGRLWALLDAYEQDLATLRYGQQVLIEVEAQPGTVLDGLISFIDPVVDEVARTAKVRVNIDNSDGRLKPGMFVRAIAQAPLGADGRALAPEFAGKWVSPMHPEIVKDEPGQCDVCGMDLVSAEALGLAGREGDVELPLVVPASAVLVTGKRAVVYVQVPETEEPTFEGREVRLGPRADEHYVVLEGLAAGERVVVHGAFRIDSSMQLRAKPSMMSQPAEPARSRALAGESEGTGEPGDDPLNADEAAALRAAVQPLVAHYLALQTALAGDEHAAAQSTWEELRAELAALDDESLAHTPLADLRDALGEALDQPPNGTSLEELRERFEPLSAALIALATALERGGEPLERTLDVVHCPMAFENRGASWLQASGAVANPYFGGAMLRCGDVERTLGGAE